MTNQKDIRDLLIESGFSGNELKEMLNNISAKKDETKTLQNFAANELNNIPFSEFKYFIERIINILRNNKGLVKEAKNNSFDSFTHGSGKKEISNAVIEIFLQNQKFKVATDDLVANPLKMNTVAELLSDTIYNRFNEMEV